MLTIMCYAFQSIFGIWFRMQVAFVVVDYPFLQYLFYFAVVNIPAIHSAARVARIDKRREIAVKAAVFSCGLMYFIPAVIQPQQCAAYQQQNKIPCKTSLLHFKILSCPWHRQA